MESEKVDGQLTITERMLTLELQRLSGGCSLLSVTDNGWMIIFTRSCWIFTGGHCAVLPAGTTFCGVAPGHSLVVGVTAVVVVQSSGKGEDINKGSIEKKKGSLQAVSLVTVGMPANPQLFLLARVVIWCAVMFVRRLSRPALASFPGLGYSDCTSVGSALPSVAAQLWDNGRGLRR